MADVLDVLRAGVEAGHDSGRVARDELEDREDEQRHAQQDGDEAQDAPHDVPTHANLPASSRGPYDTIAEHWTGALPLGPIRGVITPAEIGAASVSERSGRGHRDRSLPLAAPMRAGYSVQHGGAQAPIQWGA